MFKFVVAFAAVAIAGVAVLGALQQPPKLMSSLKLKESGKIQLQRCQTNDCSGTCTPVVEFQTGVCHPQMRLFDHGEIFSIAAFSKSRTCFRESIYDTKGGAQCIQSSVVQSAPQECGVCREDPLRPFTFRKFSGCGGTGVNLTVSLGCDENCQQCEVMIPVPSGQCNTFPNHHFLKDFSFENGAPFECGGSGWQEFTRKQFFSNDCYGEPNAVDSVFADMCYVIGKFAHKFTLLD
jgi:hypothetical protein